MVVTDTSPGNGTQVLTTGSYDFPTALTGSPIWTDYRISADVRLNPSNGHARLIARNYGTGYFYACGLDHPGLLFLGKEYGGIWYTFQTATYAFDPTTWYHIDFSVYNDTLTCTVTEPGTGRTATLTQIETYFASGGAGVTGSNYAEWDNVVVRKLQ